MNETLNIVSTATALSNKQFVQLLNAFENHQTFSQKVNTLLSILLRMICHSKIFSFAGNSRVRFNCVVDNK